MDASKGVIDLWNNNPERREELLNIIEEKIGFRVENINIFYKSFYIAIAQIVVGVIGVICCILTFCGHVLPVLIFIPVNFILTLYFIALVGFVLALCSIIISSDHDNQLIFF